MLSNRKSIFKSNWVAVREEDTRIIDTNELAEKKIKDLEIAMMEQMQKNNQDNYTDGFSEGLNAEQVEALVNADDRAEASNEAMRKEAEALAQEIQQAKEELESIRGQAERVMQEAQVQIDALREEARKEGQESGYLEGQQKALEEGERVRREFQDAELKLKREYQSELDNLEPRFIETIGSVYEHIFGIEVESNRNIITHLVGRTIRKVEGSKDFIVHVSKEEYPYVGMKKKEILDGIASSQTTVEFIEDITLAQGQCFIETEGGIFDCGLDTQLEELRKKLRLLSYEV